MIYLKSSTNSNAWFSNLHDLCKELDALPEERKDALFYATSDLATLLLENEDSLNENDYEGIVRIANDYGLDIPEEYMTE